MVRWSELAVAKASLARLASSFLFIGVENGDFSDIAAAMVAWKSKKSRTSTHGSLIWNTFTHDTLCELMDLQAIRGSVTAANAKWAGPALRKRWHKVEVKPWQPRTTGRGSWFERCQVVGVNMQKQEVICAWSCGLLCDHENYVKYAIRINMHIYQH